MKPAIIITVIFLFFVISANSQNQASFTSPSSSFESFSFKVHNGYPLLYEGVLESPRNRQYLQTEGTKAIAKYFGLLEIKYMNEYYTDLKDYVARASTFGRGNSSYWDESNKSLIGENHLRSMIDVFLKEDVWGTYKKGMPFQGFLFNWKGETEIEQARSFKQFVTGSDFSDMKSWAKKIWPEDGAEVHIVAQYELWPYDFDSGGYWISGGNWAGMGVTNQGWSYIPNRHTLMPLYFTHKPLNDFERDYASIDRSGRNKIFLEMNESEAEKLLSDLGNPRQVRDKWVNFKNPVIYGVLRVSLKRGKNDFFDKSLGPRKEILYHYPSAKIELFSDAALTKKIKTIDLNEVYYAN